jgi:hypothetical protein
MRAERKGWGVRGSHRWPATMYGRSHGGLSAAGHGCRGATSRLRREAYGRFCERQRVRLPMPTRRTFAWLCQNRRFSRDYERLCTTSEALIYAAMGRLMLTSLAKT